MEYYILELIADTNYFTYKMYGRILSHSIDYRLHRVDTHGENIISDSFSSHIWHTKNDDLILKIQQFPINT